MSVEGETDDMNVVGANVPKKRGRKRKQDISEMLRKSPDLTLVDTKSKRGRPRKQINYYELANPGLLDAISGDSANTFENTNEKLEIDVKNKKHPGSKEKKEKRHKNSINNIPIENRNNYDEDNNSFHLNTNNSENKDVNYHVAGEDDEICKKNISSADNDSETDKIAFDQNEVLKDFVGEIDEASTSNAVNKDKRYSYTGETVKMISKLFNIYSKKEDNAGSSHNNESNCSGDGSVNGKRGKKRFVLFLLTIAVSSP